MTDDFIQKLMISKQIMDKHKEMPRGQNGVGIPMEVNESKISAPDLYTPEPINASYNIPQEFMGNQSQTATMTKPPVVTEDRIKNSKLPDAIKQLMIKHPIKQPESYSPTLSSDVIDKAARLMNENKKIVQSSNEQTSKTQQPNSNDLRKIVREELQNILSENGIISESESKSNEVFQFRVGKHVFEGKITKVKKIS
jgi:hypothetical protein